ncbi:hypothetical protein E8E01_18385 [Methylorubrum populi]|uniref:hypothetical protein n=1 Tax=Methylorubrum populi TaxID=223967 RepID=UPI00114EA5F7|nr:hypothetical protein [Methylorubrum populi]QDI82256.1 hypothetical protein E8E01_18385 [Methylorubrum populi]
MAEHHKNASVGVARAVLEGLGSEERAAVEKEAREKGIDAIEIVRSSLDSLISDTEQSDGKSVFVRRSGG